MITSAVEVQIDTIYDEFETDVRPEVERRLIDIASLRNNVPGEIQACVNAGVARFDKISQIFKWLLIFSFHLFSLNTAAAAIVAAVSAC